MFLRFKVRFSSQDLDITFLPPKPEQKEKKEKKKEKTAVKTATDAAKNDSGSVEAAADPETVPAMMARSGELRDLEVSSIWSV